MSYLISLILLQSSVTSRAAIIRHLLSVALLSYSQYSNFEFVELISSVITKPYIFRLTETFHLVHLTHSYEFRQFEEITASGCRNLQKNFIQRSAFLSSGTAFEDSSLATGIGTRTGTGTSVEEFGIHSPHIPFFGNYFKSLKRCLESSQVFETHPFPSSSHPSSHPSSSPHLEFQPQHQHQQRGRVREREKETERKSSDKESLKLINLVVFRFQNDLFLELERYQKIPFQFPICEQIQQQILFKQVPFDPSQEMGFHPCDEQKFHQRSLALESNKSYGSSSSLPDKVGRGDHMKANEEEEEEEYDSDVSEVRNEF
jgi:hypothetical protein